MISRLKSEMSLEGSQLPTRQSTHRTLPLLTTACTIHATALLPHLSTFTNRNNIYIIYMRKQVRKQSFLHILIRCLNHQLSHFKLFTNHICLAPRPADASCSTNYTHYWLKNSINRASPKVLREEGKTFQSYQRLFLKLRSFPMKLFA